MPQIGSQFGNSGCVGVILLILAVCVAWIVLEPVFRSVAQSIKRLFGRGE